MQIPIPINARISDVIADLLPTAEKITLINTREDQWEIHVRPSGSDSQAQDELETLIALNNGVLRYAFDHLAQWPSLTHGAGVADWERVRDILDIDHGRQTPAAPLTTEAAHSLAKAEFKRAWGAIPVKGQDHVRVCGKGYLRSVAKCYLSSVMRHLEEHGFFEAGSTLSSPMGPWPRRLGRPAVETHDRAEGVTAHYRVKASLFEELLMPMYKVKWIGEGGEGVIFSTGKGYRDLPPCAPHPRADGDHIILPVDLFKPNDMVNLAWMRPETVMSLPRATASVLKETV